MTVNQTKNLQMKNEDTTLPLRLASYKLNNIYLTGVYTFPQILLEATIFWAF